LSSSVFHLSVVCLAVVCCVSSEKKIEISRQIHQKIFVMDINNKKTAVCAPERSERCFVSLLFQLFPRVWGVCGEEMWGSGNKTREH